MICDINKIPGITKISHRERELIEQQIRRQRYFRMMARRRQTASSRRHKARSAPSLNDPAFCAAVRQALLWCFGSEDRRRLGDPPERWYRVML